MELKDRRKNGLDGDQRETRIAPREIVREGEDLGAKLNATGSRNSHYMRCGDISTHQREFSANKSARTDRHKVNIHIFAVAIAVIAHYNIFYRIQNASSSIIYLFIIPGRKQNSHPSAG